MTRSTLVPLILILSLTSFPSFPSVAAADDTAAVSDDKPELLDTSGLNCPLPVLKAEKALKKLAKRTKLRVLATDPVSVIDIPHMCHSKGYVLVDSYQHEDVFVFDIARAD